MSITILTGLPGSGKSETVITRVNSALQEGRVAFTFLCSDSPILRARPNIVKRGRMGCRAGLSARVDHFVSTARSIDLLENMPAGALLAFDEAQHFGEKIVDSWCAASERGAEILIASPNNAQLKALSRRGYEAERLRLICQVCQEQDASAFLCHLDEDRTESVCAECSERLTEDARARIIDRLLHGGPEPGEKWIYQPVELPECDTWSVIRTDTRERCRFIVDTCAREGLPNAHSSYLDVGCNTGFFCHEMARAGFNSTGVDVAAREIEVARLMSTYFRRDYATYVQSDAHEYLKTTRDHTFDVTSAFSVFQWTMIQKTPEHGLDCMRWLFEKTRRICILEMGESTEAHYIERIGLRYDSAWIRNFMETHGGFERVELIDMKSSRFKRDLHVGFKA